MATPTVSQYFKYFLEDDTTATTAFAAVVAQAGAKYTKHVWLTDAHAVRLDQFPDYVLDGQAIPVASFCANGHTVLYTHHGLLALFGESFGTLTAFDGKQITYRHDTESPKYVPNICTIECAIENSYYDTLVAFLNSRHVSPKTSDGSYCDIRELAHYGERDILGSTRVFFKDMELPQDSFYPTFGHGLCEIYDTIAKSTAPVIFLIGDPGTAKSTFIRGYLEHTKASCMLECTKEETLVKSDLFEVSTKNDIGVIAIEDCDGLLQRRTDGNRILARFLNRIDGVRGKEKSKIFITTNIADIKDVDPALTRPGRCFATFNFSHLTQEQAKVVCEEKGLPTAPLEKKPKWTIAELMNIETLHYSTSAGGQQFGFSG